MRTERASRNLRDLVLVLGLAFFLGSLAGCGDDGGLLLGEPMAAPAPTLPPTTPPPPPP